MNNLEKTSTDSLSEMQGEILNLQAEMRSCLKDIKNNSRRSKNVKVKSLLKERCAELKYQNECATLLPGWEPITSPAVQIPQELVELRQQEELEKTKMLEDSQLIRRLLEESVNNNWEDVNSANRRATSLRQQNLQMTTEIERVRNSIEREKQDRADNRKRMLNFLGSMKRSNVLKKAENEQLKLTAKNLDNEIESLVSQRQALRTKASYERHTHAK